MLEPSRTWTTTSLIPFSLFLALPPPPLYLSSGELGCSINLSLMPLPPGWSPASSAPLLAPALSLSPLCPPTIPPSPSFGHRCAVLYCLHETFDARLGRKLPKNDFIGANIATHGGRCFEASSRIMHRNSDLLTHPRREQLHSMTANWHWIGLSRWERGYETFLFQALVITRIRSKSNKLVFFVQQPVAWIG